MEDLLKEYIQDKLNWDSIIINFYNVDGANCEVTFYTDDSKYYKEVININIWDMFIFMKK